MKFDQSLGYLILRFGLYYTASAVGNPASANAPTESSQRCPQEGDRVTTFKTLRTAKNILTVIYMANATLLNPFQIRANGMFVSATCLIVSVF
jgi:hypothetical protein